MAFRTRRSFAASTTSIVLIMMRYITVSVLLCLTFSLRSQTLRFLALGDSYTIGESVGESERWPRQLQDTLISMGYDVKLDIVAKTGWRTDELIRATRDHGNAEFDLVSLLIGVNNQYQGRPFEQFQTDLDTLITLALELVSGDTSALFFVSIPDYGVTPFGLSRYKPNTSSEIDRYNIYIDQKAKNLEVPYVYITDISRIKNEDLTASDGLHPSALQYSKWIPRILESVGLSED